MTAKKISKAKAEAALAAVKEQFKVYLEPMVMEAFTATDGTEYPERTYPPECPEPTLIEDWDGPGWAISWECGPSEWALLVNGGGTSEESRELVAAAAKEFGADPAQALASMKQIEPVTWPKGVFGEPYYSFLLCLYPA